MNPTHFQISSELNTTVEQLWQFVGTIAGVNYELFPIKMSYPKEFNELKPELFQPGVAAFRSTLSFLGIVPIGFHYVTMDQLEPPNGFHENSKSTGFETFIHKRCLQSSDNGCTLTDEVKLVPKSMYGSLMVKFYPSTFKKRHSRLIKKFGGKVLHFEVK